LASSLRLAGTGRQQPLWSELHQLDMPVLVVVGERDERYKAAGRRLVDSIGSNAAFAVIPDAGHACHMERPDAFLDAVSPFLNDDQRQPPSDAGASGTYQPRPGP
jgi:2-succinyl-6-hydroxy-2,4-cyclohexadiene-1-carboxylate synthase